MNEYLLDVNVLVAWGWADHVDHRRAASWIGSMKAKRNVMLCTSSIPELGFVRVSVQRTAGRLAVGDAAVALAEMLGALGKRHRFLADDRSSSATWADWCQSASRTTDCHLVALAANHGMILVTLDENVPGAFLIPKP